MSRLLVTGATGQIGRELVALAVERHQLRCPSRAEMDVTELETVRRVMAEVQPEVVVHCAAFTAVDKAEREPDMAYAANTLGSRNIAMAAAEAGAWLLAVSSDYVFDGRGRRPYHEFDPPAPINVYGISKLAGEREVATFCPRHTIVRTAWLFGQGDCFPRNIARLAWQRAKAGETLQVVDDQHGSPTSARAVAVLLAALIEKPVAGVVHAACEGVATWFELARTVVGELAIPVRLKPCTSAHVPRPAPRPAYSVLDNMVLRLENRPSMPMWQDELRDWLAREREELGQV